MSIKRVPIKIRKAIKLPINLRAEINLLQLKEEAKIGNIFGIVKIYTRLVNRLVGKGRYQVLDDNPTEHPNWVHFETVYEICEAKRWDAPLYVKAQFDRYQKSSGRRFPLPSMLHTVKALEFFVDYISDIQQKYEKDVGGKKKEKYTVKRLRDEVIDGIVTSAEVISSYLDSPKIQDSEQHKAMRIFSSWEEYSPYYLWSIPWFHELLNEMPKSDPKYKSIRSDFSRISSSKNLQYLISNTVQQVEEHYNIPKNIDL